MNCPNCNTAISIFNTELGGINEFQCQNLINPHATLQMCFYGRAKGKSEIHSYDIYFDNRVQLDAFKGTSIVHGTRIYYEGVLIIHFPEFIPFNPEFDYKNFVNKYVKLKAFL